MKTNSKINSLTKSINIGIGIDVSFMIEKKGQVTAHVSDKLITRLSIQLPVKNDLIIDEIRFCNRISFFDRGLYSNTTFSHHDRVGYYEKDFFSNSYSEGFRLAESYAVTELSKISNLLCARSNALIEGDDI